MASSEGQAEVATSEEILLTLFAGVGDSECHLSLLRGMPHILKLIYMLATNEHRRESRWKRCIRLPDIHTDAEIMEVFSGHQDWEFNIAKSGIQDRGNLLFLTEIDRYLSLDSRFR